MVFNNLLVPVVSQAQRFYQQPSASKRSPTKKIQFNDHYFKKFSIFLTTLKDLSFKIDSLVLCINVLFKTLLRM